MSSDEHEGRGGGQVAAFLVGLAIGAGAALLLAPQSGARTRADIVRRAKRVRRAATRFAGDVRERAEDAYDVARTEIRERVREARRGVDGVLEDVKERVDAGREAGRAAARAARVELTRRLADAGSESDDDA